MQKIYPNYSTPKINDPRLLTFSQMVGNEKLLTIPFNNELLPIGNCYWNVEFMVKKYGGSIIYGWIYNIWEGILIEAMHHAIWQKIDGTLLDVTFNYPMLSQEYIIFQPDGQSKLTTLDLVPSIQNHHFFLTNENDALDFVNLNKHKIYISKQYQLALYNSGYRCELQRAAAYSGQRQENVQVGLNIKSEEIRKIIMEAPQIIQQLELKSGAYIPHLNQLSMTYQGQ